MPMDGLMLGFAARELSDLLVGGRIDKVTQPEKDTLILLIRSQNQNCRLLLCASPNNARCHLSEKNFLNPMEPPMFCMLMRKHLQGGRVASIRQIGGDRMIYIEIDSADELGITSTKTLILEIMGRHSNLTLTDANGRIVDAIRHVNYDMSRVRQVLPGLPYEAPPAQDKFAPKDLTVQLAEERLTAATGMPLFKALSSIVSGLSGPSARELACRLTGAQEDAVWDRDIPALATQLCALLGKLNTLSPPQVLFSPLGDALDVYPFPYVSRDLGLQQPQPSISKALEHFFGTRDQQDRISQKSASLNRQLKTHIERCEKKLALQIQELTDSARMEEYRITGDLITTNLYQLKKGQEKAVLPNYYDPEGGTMTVTLDIQLTPVQNAQRYFKKYQKARSAKEVAATQKIKTEQELYFLEGALDDLQKCVEEAELQEVRQELYKAGYIRASHNRKPQRKLPESKPYRYISQDGIPILVGKNSIQNDRLTGNARGGETWLHAKDMPGSHVIIQTEASVPQATLLEAAQLAAYYSKGKNSGAVPIDYTLRKHVKKPGGSPAGFVIYTNQRTLFITVTQSDIKVIREDA